MNTTDTTATSETYKEINLAIETALELVKNNVGNFVWDDADCELTQSVHNQIKVFKKIEELTSDEKLKIAVGSLVNIGKRIAEYQAALDKTNLVIGHILEDTDDDVKMSLVKESHFRLRKVTLAKDIAHKLERSFS